MMQSELADRRTARRTNPPPYRFVAAFAVVLLLVGGFCVPAAGQITLTGGIVSSTHANVPEEAAEAVPNSRQGIAGGIALTVPLAWRLALRLGAEYRQMGGTVTRPLFYDFSGGTGHRPMVLGIERDLVALSPLVEFRLMGGGSGLRAYVLAGPTAGYEVACVVSDARHHAQVGDSCVNDVRLKKLDVWMTGGLGIAAPVLGPLNLLLEATYDFGVLKLDDGVVNYDFPHQDRSALTSRAMVVRAGLRVGS